MEIDISNLVVRFIIAISSLRVTNQPSKGRGQSHMTHLNFVRFNHISGTAEAKVVKFGVHVGDGMTNYP